MGYLCVTVLNSFVGSPPIRWVGESGNLSSGNASSSFSSSLDGKEKSGTGEATAAELIGGFDERMRGLFEDFAKLKALIESGQPVKLTTGVDGEPLKFDASILDPLRQLSEFLRQLRQ